jgi:hypothetical protein
MMSPTANELSGTFWPCLVASENDHAGSAGWCGLMALASMEPRDFDMRRADRCICGHALRLFGRHSRYFGSWESQLGAGANLLSLSTDQARELFAPVNRARHSAPYTHPRDAARVVRYLAASDTVDWSVAGKL